MSARAFFIVPLFFAPVLAFSQAEFVPEIQFSCGEAAVTIEVIKRDFPQRELRLEPVLTITLNDVSTTLRYWGSIDFIGGMCSADARGRPMVVYRASCGGSGCDVEGNWGIINATNLRVLLVPRDSNQDVAREILGGELPEIQQRISVRRADQRLYPDQQ